MSDRRADAASRHAAVASSRASPRGRSVPPSPLSCSSPAAAALSHSLAAKAASPASAARQPSDGLHARGARHSPVRLFDDSDRPHRARKGSAQPDQPLFVPRLTPRTTCSASGPGMLRDTTTVTRRHLLSAVGCEDPRRLPACAERRCRRPRPSSDAADRHRAPPPRLPSRGVARRGLPVPLSGHVAPRPFPGRGALHDRGGGRGRGGASTSSAHGHADEPKGKARQAGGGGAAAAAAGRLRPPSRRQSLSHTVTL